MRGMYRSPAGRQRITTWCRERLEQWDAPHRRSTLVTAAGPTHVVEAGAPAARDVVYLPGTNFNAATSLGLLAALARHCRVFAVDLPGQPGLSAPERPRPETPGYARWVTEVVDGLPVSAPPLLVGHSRGAAVALTADPAQVAGLLLLNPAGLVKTAVTRTVLRTAVPWIARPTQQRSAALLTLMAAAGREPDPQHVEWLTLVARETRTTGAPGPLPPQLVARWREGTVRVVSGAADCFFPPSRLGPAVREQLGVELEVLSGAGHLTVDEATDSVVARVRALTAAP